MIVLKTYAITEVDIRPPTGLHTQETETYTSTFEMQTNSVEESELILKTLTELQDASMRKMADALITIAMHNAAERRGE